MVASAETFSLGMPVDIGRIDRELKKLWIESGGVKTRASLVNLAVYSETPDSLPANTQIVSKITENHACRAIVIGANRQAKENRVEAWVTAHCHVSRAGNKQVCCEQLSFLLEGPCTRLLPNIVFSHLDSDLPFYLWWQGEFHEAMDPQLWAWVDRVIYDSQQWSDFRAQMQRVETAQKEAKQRVLLCDLNWTRLVQLRLAIAQFFDDPASRARFEEIESVAIDFAPGYRSTALLLIGWLAAQLGWSIETKTKNDTLAFRHESGNAIQITLQENGTVPISRCILDCGSIEFRVTTSADSELLHVMAGARDEMPPPQLMPAGSNDPVELMGEELMGVGRHRVYLRAMNCVRDLL
jgi:glucose-6-phosphate dehydrogenase assembly protein OpcA